MKKLFNINRKTAILLYIIADTICIGMGMGVPFFCILLGFPLGWYITRRISMSSKDVHLVYSKIFKTSLLTVTFTFLLLIIIWGRTVIFLFDPAYDFENFGHPFILYDPKLSFIGWLILMMFISPFLQLLTTIFASFITLLRIEAKR